jgi:hypothetical protein
MAKKANPWTLFVKKVFKENPGKTLGQAMKIASTLKKQGKMNGNANASMKSKTKKRKSRRK